ncbi:MAG: DUF2182 domain-containing protein, partial [Actinomycetota bacterium]|nr:DUF2182 domain-containing protein [Actinomycetota bacterium]
MTPPVRQRGTTLLLLAAIGAGWAVAVERMRGMDEGPATDLGPIGSYAGTWLAMIAAMMLPSAAPAIAATRRSGRLLPTLVFAAGYLLAWTAYGLAAYGVFRLLTSFDAGWLGWHRAGPYAVAGTIGAAAIYELTPLKQRFLARCRRVPRDRSPLRAGLANGLSCVGCCFALMVVLFALGVMSILWMAVVAGVIFAEKVVPHGLRLPRAVAPAMAGLAIWVAVSPATVPGLTQPDESP